MPQQQPVRRKTQASKAPVVIPDKLYFRIGDVSRLCGLPAYVLRFWETEFPQLKPNKGGTGQRLYRKRDVETVLEIKRLLYDEGFTIAGARRLLVERRRTADPGSDASRKASAKPGQVGPQAVEPSIKLTKSKIKALREQVRELLALLNAEPAPRKAPASARKESKKDSKKARIADAPTLF